MAFPQSEHIVDVLRRRVDLHPDHPVYTFLAKGETPVKTLSYADLDRRARAIAASLRERASGQERALMVYSSGLEFIEAFWACLYARIIAVPANPPRNNNQGLSRLAAMKRDCSPQLVLSTRRHLENLSEVFSGIEAIATDEVGDEGADHWRMEAIGPEEIALLQYSSGSTATPKGIVVPHRSIQANQHMIRKAFRHSESSTFVGWLPFFHDMGLFGNIIQPLFIGAHSLLMSPLSFLQKPVRWLKAISQHRAHSAGAPNFAYEYCTRRIREEEKAGLDLSCWKRAFNGAEKPRAETMEGFARAFARTGFREEAFYPCYGLAEAVLFVTGRDTLASPRIARATLSVDASGVEPAFQPVVHASSGCSWLDQRVAIVDPLRRTERPEGSEGEIWVKGSGLAEGYWGRPSLTQETFQARLANDGEGPFLRTGDLGFLRSGELFITGRLKDLIIIRGQNYHPEDIEAAIEESHDSLGSGQCAAFGIESGPGGGERLAVIIEVGKSLLQDAALQALCDHAAATVSNRFEIAVGELALVAKGTIPKTTSGKIKRFRCRDLLLAGQLNPIRQIRYDDEILQPDESPQAVRRAMRERQLEAAREMIRASLLRRLGRLLPQAAGSQLTSDSSLIQCGLDSLRAVQLRQWIEEAFAATVPIQRLFENATVDSLVEAICSDLPAEPGEDRGAQADRAAWESEGLSQGQRALYYEYEKDPSSSAHNISIAIRLSGTPNREVLRASLTSLWRRHPQLRATYYGRGSEALQRIGQADEPPLEFFDASACSQADLKGRIDRDANRPFDLGRSSLRFACYDLGSGESVLLIVVHHLSIDLFSLEILLGDWAASLAHASPGGRRPSADRAAAYSDFVAWQRQYLASPRSEASLRFWTEMLRACAPSPRLAFSRTATDGAVRGRVHRFRLDPNETEAVRAFATREEATPYMVLFSAYALLLGQYCRESQLTIGASVSGRPAHRFSEVIGYFANMMALPIRVDGQASFLQVLAQSKRIVSRALDHQDYPYSLLVEKLGKRLNLDRGPLVRYAFTYGRASGEGSLLGLLHEDSSQSASLGPLTATGYPLDRRMAPFELTLLIVEREGSLEASFSYAENLLESGAIAVLADAFRSLLSALIRQPGLSVSRLGFAPADELEHRPDAPSLHEETVSVLQRFECHARANPESIALLDQDRQLSYGELNRRGETLGHRLRRRGVGPDSIVALFCPRGLEMVIGILGILKAGGAYLPIDVTYPQQRLRFLVEDAGAELALTVSDYSEACRSAGCDAILLDQVNWNAGASAAAAPTSTPPDPDSLAYIIYTSGSTGRPKGVAVTQRNLSRLFDSTRECFDFSADDAWILFHSISFDFSVWEIWGALTHGGKLTILDQESARDPHRVLGHIRRHGISVLNSTPSAFHNLQQVIFQSARDDRLPLRCVIFGGEALKPDQLKPWFELPAAAGAQLVNMYGITETTVHTTWLKLDAQSLNAPVGSPIGRAIDDVELFILNDDQRRLPPYALGEIGVAGAGLARGYHRRPGLTASRFIPDPFGHRAGSRLYLSGDLAYANPALQGIQYFGRLDQQVKIRGHRIEIGEIEAQVRECEGVDWAMVLASSESDGAGVLTAYLVCSSELSVSTLRQHLLRFLPDFMIPARFVRVESVPLNENGKVDVERLRSSKSFLPSGTDYAAPRSEVEKRLVRIWSQTLGADHIGIDDNYFALGGDSIRSIRIVSKALEEDIPLELSQLVSGQTIRRIAESLPSQAPSKRTRWSRPYGLIAEEVRKRLPGGLTDAFPVDSLTQGLVFHSQFSDDYQAYVTTFHLRAPWHPRKLESAIAATLNRHDYLRSSIDLATYGEPLQLVHASVDAELSIEDIRGIDAEEQETHLQHWLEAEKLRRFDWSQAPLLRFTAHRRSQDSFQLTSCEPYLDGWCVALVYRELLETYLALVQGNGAPMRDRTAISQRHYVQLERATAADADSRQFWRRYLDAAPVSSISRLACKPTAPSALHDRKTAVIPDSLVEGLEAIARSASVPVRTVFQAAHACMLSALLGQDEVVFGVILNGRPEEADGDEAIGSFLNTAPLRVRIDRQEPWKAFLGRLFSIENEILPHRRFPYAQIKNLCSGGLEFDTVFNFTYFHALGPLVAREGLEILNVYASEQTFFPFTAHFNRSILTSELELVLDYDSRRFSADLIALVAEGFFKIFATMGQDPRRKGGLERSLGAVEQLFFPQPRLPEPGTPAPSQEDVVLQRIDRLCRQAPDSIAIAAQEMSLTYRQLESCSRRLAAHLSRGLGVGPEDRIALCSGRSLHSVIAALAVLRTGAAFVPIDQSCPRSRMEHLLGDCQPMYILAPQSLLPRVAGLGVPALALDPFFSSARQAQPTLDCPPIHPRQLAYLIYTSGSTGWPKGVGVEHGSLQRFASAAVDEYGIVSQDRVLQFSSPAFDLWIEEVFMSLCAGAALVIPPSDLLDSYERFRGFCSHEAITLLDVPTAFWSDWVRESPPPESLAESIRTVIIGGQKMETELASKWLQGAPRKVLLLNTYGPTETTVVATKHPVSSPPGGSSSTDAASSPIGTALGQAWVCVADSKLRPLASGIQGELHIGGPVLARGYHERPGLTAERFLPDPSGRSAGARVYRTGDICFTGKDGVVHFAGRADLQVKIRGYRVELEEVEAALERCTGVRRSAALAQVSDNGAAVLAALVQPDDPSLLESASWERQVRAELQGKLPGYMVPTILRSVERITTTPSGKVDRPAIEKLALGAEEGSAPSLAARPADPLEEIVAGICGDCLGLQGLRPGDDFFALGGDSLLAMRAAARLRSALECRVSVRDVFESRTGGELAHLLRMRLASNPQGLQAVSLTPGEPTLSFGQERLWMADHLSFGAAAFNIPAAIRIKGPFNSFAFEQSLREVQRRHRVLRTRIVLKEGRLRPVYDAGLGIELQRADLSGAAQQRNGRSALGPAREFVEARFRLDCDPLIRASLTALSADEHLLTIVIHHIAADGWSLDLLIRELVTLYSSFARGEPSALPEPAVQYWDYARCQKERISGAYKERLLAYWKDTLEGMPDYVELPLDYRRPSVNEFRGKRSCFHLDRGLAASLRKLSGGQGVTLFMTLLAAYKALLHRYSGQTDIVVGMPVAHREWPETEGLIGLFVNQLVVRTDLSGGPTFRQLLSRVRTSLLSAFDYQDLPFEELVALLKPQRDAVNLPLVQTLFAYWDKPWQDFSIEGVELEFPEIHNGAAKYDLEVQLVPSSDGGLQGYCEYNVSLFSPQTVRRLARDYLEVLRIIVEQPDRPIGAPLPTPAQPQQSLESIG